MVNHEKDFFYKPSKRFQLAQGGTVTVDGTACGQKTRTA
jgi:hypothetical protein